MSPVDIDREAVTKEHAQADTEFAFVQATRRNDSIAAWKTVNQMMDRYLSFREHQEQLPRKGEPKEPIK
jgi:hypothetical protein